MTFTAYLLLLLLLLTTTKIFLLYAKGGHWPPCPSSWIRHCTIVRRGKWSRLLPENERENEASSHRSSLEVVRAVPERLEDLLQLSEHALDTEMRKLIHRLTRTKVFGVMAITFWNLFCEEWVSHLDREDRTALGIFLYVQMKTLLAKG